jgi:hypothetical protein
MFLGRMLTQATAAALSVGARAAALKSVSGLELSMVLEQELELELELAVAVAKNALLLPPEPQQNDLSAQHLTAQEAPNRGCRPPSRSAYRQQACEYISPADF